MAISKRLFPPSAGGVVPSENFAPVTYTGNSTNDFSTALTQSITGVGFQPDLVWIKNRNSTYTHAKFDVVRGATYQISSNSTAAQTQSNGYLKSFDSDGFGLGGDYAFNRSGYTYVAWCWKAGGAAVSNTDGTITSQVSANQAAGFSIVSYTGDGSSSSTVGHGLSSTPEMVIIKNISDAFSWAVRHSALASTDNLYLNATNGATPVSSTAHGGVGSLSSTTIGFLSGATTLENINTLNDNYIAYCFHSVDGYQKVGTYAGGSTGSGNEITTGFQPRFILTKSYDVAESWSMFDSQRNGSGTGGDGILFANTSDAENSATDRIEFTSTGFYWETTQAGNISGRNYIYLAIA